MWKTENDSSLQDSSAKGGLTQLFFTASEGVHPEARDSLGNVDGKK